MDQILHHPVPGCLFFGRLFPFPPWTPCLSFVSLCNSPGVCPEVRVPVVYLEYLWSACHSISCSTPCHQGCPNLEHIRHGSIRHFLRCLPGKLSHQPFPFVCWLLCTSQSSIQGLSPQTWWSFHMQSTSFMYSFVFSVAFISQKKWSPYFDLCLLPTTPALRSAPSAVFPAVKSLEWTDRHWSTECGRGACVGGDCYLV